MNTKHISGPWIAEDDQSIYAADGDGRRLIAECHAGHKEERAANARLIAAAPALLSALEAAKEVLETAKQYFPKSIKNGDRFSLLNVLANAVNPAITKANQE